jgi:hypothetical protein
MGWHLILVAAVLVGEVRVVTRKGEVARARLRRQWSNHVALSGEKVRGHKNYDVVYTFAEAFSVGPRTFWVRWDDLDFEVFCFAKPEDADAFCEQFGGKRLPSDARR